MPDTRTLGEFLGEFIASLREKRRKRAVTLSRALREAAKAGVSVQRAYIEADGKVVLVFGEPEPNEDRNPWLADLRDTNSDPNSAALRSSWVDREGRAHHTSPPRLSAVRLPGLPGSANSTAPTRPRSKRHHHRLAPRRDRSRGSVSMAVAAYYGSTEFTALATGTKIMRRTILETVPQTAPATSRWRCCHLNSSKRCCR